MGLLQELLLTALFAVFFSFLIAKLVSMAMSCGDSSRNSHVSVTQNVYQNIVGEATEDVQYREMLQVDRFKSEKSVEFVADEAQIVDKFVKGSAEVDEIKNSVETNQVSKAECCELPAKSIEEISEVISGTEFQVNSGLGVNFVEEIVDEKELGVEEKIKFGMDLLVEKDAIEESESEGDEKQIKIDSDDDDWEGIERSELENIFAKATKFMEAEDLTSAGSDVQMELYGLHKIATEGPCREQAPMPLKVAARAKCDGEHWFRCARNAWQRLGNMSPEVAMEQYVAIVSDNVPAWKEGKFVDDGKPEPLEVAAVEVVTSDKSIPSYAHPNYTEHSKSVDDISSAGKDDLTVGPILEDLGKE